MRAQNRLGVCEKIAPAAAKAVLPPALRARGSFAPAPPHAPRTSPRWALLLLASALLAGCASKDGILRGKVIALADGDTITVLDGKTQHKIRLTGIDAPERRQPFSRRSAEHLASFIFER